jgi:hypothetical protein
VAFSKSDLAKFSALKCKGNELYDLAIPGMKQMYDEIVRSEPSHAISRDTTSFEEIKDSINDAAREHQGDGIVILSGAYRHMIGALADLQKTFNIEYVPIDGMQISTETSDSMGELLDKSSNGKVSQKDLQVQIKRDIGVTKHLGQDTMEALRKTIESKSYDPSKRTLVVVAAHETGLHHLDNYTKSKDKALAAIERLIPNLSERPGFVSYIGEDLHLENMRRTVSEPKIDAYPRNAFLQKLHQSGIPVEVGAFGHRDRTQGFGSGMGLGFGGGFDNFGISDFRERFKPKSGGSQTFRGGERTDPKLREGGWSENS